MSGTGARIGLFGGSFDPIHNGHIRPVLAARESLGLDVRSLSADCPPAAQAAGNVGSRAAAEHDVELALMPFSQLIVSDAELDLRRSVYTVETVERYATEFPEAELHLLLGVDSFNELPGWRRFDELIEAVKLVVLARPGSVGSTRACVRPSRGREATFSSVNRSVDASSSDIRRRLAQGADVSADLMPDPVLRYCRKYGLYR